MHRAGRILGADLNPVYEFHGEVVGGRPGFLESAYRIMVGNGNGASAKWQEVATKLDLAKAYEEMGDKDGARELLNEVLREGDSAQQGQANQILAKLG